MFVDEDTDREFDLKINICNKKMEQNLEKYLCCSICFNNYIDLQKPVLLSCGHTLCHFCFQRCMIQSYTCPFCRQTVYQVIVNKDYLRFCNYIINFHKLEISKDNSLQKPTHTIVPNKSIGIHCSTIANSEHVTLLVTHVAKNSPSSSVGIITGDIVLYVNGLSISSYEWFQKISNIHVKFNLPLDLTIQDRVEKYVELLPTKCTNINNEAIRINIDNIYVNRFDVIFAFNNAAGNDLIKKANKLGLFKETDGNVKCRGYVVLKIFRQIL